MTIGERIKQIREEKEISQTELAKAIHTTKQNIYKYENNIISNIPSDKIEAIAKYLSVSPAYLMGWEDEDSSQPYEQFNNIYPIKLKRFPLLRDIACGEPIYAEEGYESYVCADEDIKAVKYINKEGLIGKYSIFIEIDGVLYKTDEYVKF